MLRRLYRRSIWGAAGVAVFLALTAQFVSAALGYWTPCSFSLFVLVVGLAASRIFAFRQALRLELKAVEHDGEICLVCGYSLHGLPVEHHCPECGIPYRLSMVKASWNLYLAAIRSIPLR